MSTMYIQRLCVRYVFTYKGYMYVVVTVNYLNPNESEDVVSGTMHKFDIEKNNSIILNGAEISLINTGRLQQGQNV